MYVDTAARPNWPVLTPARRVLDALASRLTSGVLTVTLPSGERASYRGAEPGPAADIRIHRLRAFRRLLTGGDIGFAQSYLDGDWDSDDLVALIELGAQNEASLGQAIEGRNWTRALNRGLHLLRRNTKRGSRRNIAAHYDLGNEFYRLWLDPTMTYSAALFAEPGETLEAAQERKYARMAEIAGLRPEHEVLEIGCGWGGCCVWAARKIGCWVTAVTISQRQYDYAKERIAVAGLSERVEVRLQDYRDLRGQYDRIVSIEMLEAVGERYWPVFFETLRARLTPGGRAALQVITIDDAAFPAYRDRADFVQRYVFPGGMLPSPPALRAAVGGAGLTWERGSDHGADYARTLADWHWRFEQAWPEIAALGFDERFHRLWRFYLAYCEAGFRGGRVGLMQVGLSRPQYPQ
jgi:cyclopropane-fatty-acyl-phospholipid synthase